MTEGRIFKNVDEIVKQEPARQTGMVCTPGNQEDCRQQKPLPTAKRKGASAHQQMS